MPGVGAAVYRTSRDTSIILSSKESSLFHYQLVACSSNVQDPDAGIAGEAVTEAGDKYLEAAGVEEVVIAPEGKENALGGDDVAASFA